MKEQKKKRLITALLFASCVISGFLLLNSSPEEIRRLQSFAEADSLIRNEFRNFNITDDQVRMTQITVDSNFVRKTYRVRVAPQFSKTQFHAELNETFYPYQVSTPGKMIFPNRDVTIHLEFNDTIFRTIRLQSDPDLSLTRNLASMLLVFDEVPGDDILNELISLGEPFPVVLKADNPMEADRMRDELDGRYPRIIYWMQSGNNGGSGATPKEVQATLKQMREVMPGATILYLDEDDEQLSSLYRQSGLTVVSLSSPVIFDNIAGKSTFMDKLDAFAGESVTQNHPVALVHGGERIISWIRERLPELKKNGVEFVPPPQAE